MSPQILLIDNYDDVRILVKDWLSEIFPHCHILEARDSEEGITVATLRRPHIVVIDIGPQALETTWRLKTVAPETKIVVMAPAGSFLCGSEVSSLGVDAFLPKTESHRELAPAIENLLGNLYDERPDLGPTTAHEAVPAVATPAA